VLKDSSKIFKFTSIVVMLVIVLSRSVTVEAAGQDYDLSSLSSTQQGFKLASGAGAASSAGDFNGDGVDDVIIGSPSFNSDTGIVYVMFGKKNVVLADINLPTFTTADLLVFAFLPRQREINVANRSVL